jgi:glycerol-3-phosphate dehydrogenase
MSPVARPGKIDCVVLAEGANGLGAVRSLARHGLGVAVIVASQKDPSVFSRFPVDKQ